MALTFSPRRFTVSVPVYPPIPMIQSSALALATNLGQKLSLTDIHMADEVWEYRRPHATEGQPRGRVTVKVDANKVSLEHRYPATGLEHFERLVQQVLSSFTEPFAPQFAFAVNIELDYVVDLGIDARQSLLDGLGLLQEGDTGRKIESFKRPCHLVGLRLGFPPYQYQPAEKDEPEEEESEPPDKSAPKPADEAAAEGAAGAVEAVEPTPPGENWQAFVTMTTLDDDPTKLSVEISGTWVEEPYPWDNLSDNIEKKLDLAETYLRNRVSEFLQHFSSHEDEDEN